MKPVPLHADLDMLEANHPAARALVDGFRRTAQDAAGTGLLLAQIGTAGELGCFRTSALLLKADWEAHERRGRTNAATAAAAWRPWEDADRFATHLACFDDAGTLPIELLLLEQCALACHLLGAAQVAELAEQHARASALIARAPAAQQQAFAADKSAWLHREFEYEALVDIRRQIVDEIEAARMAFLSITGRAYAELVEGAHILALWRYRLQFNDITLTVEEMSLRLAHDLDEANANLEPDLRLALLDSIQELRKDHQAMRRLALLHSLGQTEPASEEDLRRAARLFQQLARKIHEDVLTQREDYASISPQNRRRLKEIWTEASATHRNRVHLAKDKLLNYSSHLEAWHVEVDRILRHLSFHSPSRLLEGETLEEMHDDLRRAIAEVQQYLHAVRDDIAQLQLDPQHTEYQRVIHLSADEREAELARMRTRADECKAEAASIEARMLANAAADAGADAAALKAKKP